MGKSFTRLVTWYLVAAMFLIAVAPRAEAGLSASEAVKALEADRAGDIGKIQQALEMKMVRERLEALGFTQDEVVKKLALMSDSQLHGLALNLDDLNAGGDSLGLIIALLIVAILVVVLIQLMGHRVVVTKN